MLQQKLELTTAQSSLFLTFFSIPAALFVPLSGILSDRFGRKRIALVSLILIIIGSAVSAFFKEEYSFMLLGRLIQGFGAGGVAPLAMVFISDLYSGEQRNKAFGLIEVFNGVGKVISPIIGSLLLLSSWLFSFGVLIATSTLAFVGIWAFVPEQKLQTGKQESIHMKSMRIRILFVHHWRWLLPIFLSGGIGMFLLFGYLFYSSHVLNTPFNGFILALPLLALTLSSFETGKVLKEKEDSYKRGILFGFGLMIVGTWSIILCIGTIFIFIGMTLFGIGFGMVLPSVNAALASIVSEKERGTIFALYSMCRFLGIALSPICFGIWMSDAVQLGFTSFFFVGLIGLSLLFSWTCFPVGKSCSRNEDLS